jgi:hypothetical protein
MTFPLVFVNGEGIYGAVRFLAENYVDALCLFDVNYVTESRILMGYRAENFSELLVRIQVILRVIPGETLVEVFSSA